MVLTTEKKIKTLINVAGLRKMPNLQMTYTDAENRANKLAQELLK